MNDNKRTSNFTHKEIDLLISVVKKYSHIVECKKTDAATWKQKEETWTRICAEYNAANVGGAPRTAKNLKTKFDNLKKTTKKKFAAEKQEMFKTGGGTCTSIAISQTDMAVKDILSIGVTGLSNDFDSDSYIDPNERNKENVISVSYDEESLDDVNFLHSYAITEVTAPACDAEEVAGPSCENPQWASWNPAILKQKKAAPLCVNNTALSSQKDTPTCSGVQRTSLSSDTGTPCSSKRKKSDLTTDCRIKINTVSDAKLELLKLQQESVKLEMKRKEEEHNLQMQHAKELHELKVQQLKLEIARLKQL